VILLLLALQDPFAGYEPRDLKSSAVADGRATLVADKWGFLLAPGEHADLALEASFTIDEPAKQFRYFGEHWSVWPDLSYGDQGWEAALLLRAGADSGYRVQVSHRLQEVALVKYPQGGYLRSVPCPINLKEPHAVAVTVQANRISVRIDGTERISFVDSIQPLAKGRFGIGASSGAKVGFAAPSLRALPAAAPSPAAKHVPDFSVRKWLGGRPWIFDGAEPVLMLVSAQEAYINNVKLRPGFKPLLSWNSYWETSNQGAFPEGAAKPGDATVTGGGKTLRAGWTATGVKGRFVQRITTTAGWDERRETYTWDVEGELEVLPGEPFHFKYGYDFEHHTPLDPFRWQYLVVRREGGRIDRRPVYPIDPGVMDQVEQSGGARVWYGRHNEPMVVAPAVEYDLPEAGKRKLSTAVCAAFYDTGVAFGAETAPPGTKVRVKYRYTGWPAEEAEQLFRASTLHESPMLDPGHRYVFADEWPKLTFSKSVPMSETWIYGRRPFMTGHNRRPTYALARTGSGGFALRLGPGAYGAADLPIPAPLPQGRWSVTALAKAENVHGPGGRIELAAKDKDGKVLRRETHHVGNGTWDWKRIAFATDVPSGARALSVGFGNAGTGDVLFTDVEFAELKDAALAPADPKPAPVAPAPAGALADYRMLEGRGAWVLDHASGPFGMLELANVDWTTDEGRPALRFADPPPGRRDVVRMGPISQNYLKTIDWSGTPVAIGGFHGGGMKVDGLTIAAWIKPAARMGKDKGDLVGVGARRFILRLAGREAPYRLSACLNVNDTVTSGATLEAGRWRHVAMTAAPEAGQWRVRLFLDGKPAGEGLSAKFASPASIPPSCILGSELFYLHDAWYRGLIGRTILLGRPAALGEIEAFAGESP
jgi:hypothetical protein